jgi:hypothetical protein
LLFWDNNATYIVVVPVVKNVNIKRFFRFEKNGYHAKTKGMYLLFASTSQT